MSSVSEYIEQNPQETSAIGWSEVRAARATKKASVKLAAPAAIALHNQKQAEVEARSY